MWVKGKGKAVPLQAWRDTEGSRKLRFPDSEVCHPRCVLKD